MKKKTAKLSDLLFYTTLIFLSATTLFPIIWTFLTSLKTQSSLLNSIPLWYGFNIQNNYYQPFIKQGYFDLLLNSLLTSIGCIIVSVPIGFLAAYAFSRYKIFGAHTLLFWVITCRMIPVATLIIPYYILITKLRIYDNTLTLISLYTLFNLPIAIFLIKSGLDSIPTAIDEAALIDGASIAEVLGQVIFPLVLPVIAVSSIMVFIFSWNEYLIASIVTGSNSETFMVGIRAFASCCRIQYAKMAAVTMISLIPPVIVVSAFQRYIISGLTLGSVKQA